MLGAFRVFKESNMPSGTVSPVYTLSPTFNFFTDGAEFLEAALNERKASEGLEIILKSLASMMSLSWASPALTAFLNYILLDWRSCLAL